MSQVQNENGDTAWIHVVLNCDQHTYLTYDKPLQYHTHQNIQDPSSSSPFESHNFTKNSISNNIPSQRPQNETKWMPTRLTRGQIPARFKAFIMQYILHTHIYSYIHYKSERDLGESCYSKIHQISSDSPT